jgi:hypothetical protein
VVDVPFTLDTKFSPTAVNLQTSPTLFLPNPTHSPSVAYVQGLYHNVLGRDADPDGLNAWVDALSKGTPRSQIVQAFWQSTEHHADEVDSYYRYYLGRIEGPAEQSSWIEQLNNGLSEDQAVLQFLGSAEYSKLHASNNDFVTALYSQVLGRIPDAAGFSSFLSSLAGGASRSAVASDFLHSDEANELAINSYYFASLKRAPAAAEIDSWLQLTQGGGALADIAQYFLASDEYVADAQASVH